MMIQHKPENSFKFGFKAAMGYYAAQFLMSLIAIILFVAGVYVWGMFNE